MKNAQGFTLIELIVVVSVIAILAGIVVPVVGSVLDEARNARMVSEVKTLALACIQYEKDNGYLPYRGLYGGRTTYAYAYNTYSMNRLNNLISKYLSRRIITDPFGTAYRYWQYDRMSNMRAVMMSCGKNRRAQCWNSRLWNTRGDNIGDDYYMVFK